MDPEQLKRTYEGVFNRSAATYGQVGPGYFAYFGRRLVEFARISAGARVLDVACGRGAVLFPATEAVGPSGEVTGVDLSARMVDETLREITARGIPNARVIQMDAEHLRFDDARFDIVVSGFALFFFPQLNQALDEIRRVLVPGGQVAVSTWGSNRDKRWEWLGKLFETYAPPEPEEAAKTQQAGPDFGTPDGLKSILAGGGFHDLRTQSETETFAFHTEEEWWSANWSHGGRFGLEELERTRGTAILELFKARAFEHLQTFKAPDGFPETLEVMFTSGKKE